MIILVPFRYFHLYIVLPDKDPAGPRHVGSTVEPHLSRLIGMMSH